MLRVAPHLGWTAALAPIPIPVAHFPPEPSHGPRFTSFSFAFVLCVKVTAPQSADHACAPVLHLAHLLIGAAVHSAQGLLAHLRCYLETCLREWKMGTSSLSTLGQVQQTGPRALKPTTTRQINPLRQPENGVGLQTSCLPMVARC